jgi:4-nitrotryptophan synthase
MRYDDCHNAFRDPALSAERMDSVLGVKFPADELPEDSIYYRFVGNVVMYTDPPLHTTLRKSVAPAFDRAAHEYYDDAIRGAACELVDALPEGAVELDAVRDLALRLPWLTASRAVGLPAEDLDFVVPKVNTIMSFWSGPQAQPVPLAEVLDRLTELHEYAQELIEGKQGVVLPNTAFARLLENPPDVPLHQVIHQVVLTIMALFAPTTPGSISSGLLSFARNPEQIRLFREDPDGADAAANEIFRYNASNQFTWRLAASPTTIGDVHVEAGDVVTLFIGSANHDAAVFDEPHEFRIRRPNSGDHLTFGAGLHSCLGRKIAHLQVRWLMTALFRRFASVEVAGRPVWNENLEFRSLRSLPLRLA